MKGVILLFAFCAVPLGAAPRACDLLTGKDLAAVQGQAFVETKPTEARDGALAVSQCFYRLPTLTQSVSVSVLTGSHADAASWWKTHFGETADGEERERADEEEMGKALRVTGIGDAAAWSGNRNAGALYVLRGDAILRVSVGGEGSQQQKLARSKRLAAKAIKRL